MIKIKNGLCESMYINHHSNKLNGLSSSLSSANSLTDTDNHHNRLNDDHDDNDSEEEDHVRNFVPFPHALRTSSQSPSSTITTATTYYAYENLVGCAAHRGLLSLDCPFF